MQHPPFLLGAPDGIVLERQPVGEHVAVDGNNDLKMTFDYKLRPGPATSGNALALVHMLGLDHE